MKHTKGEWSIEPHGKTTALYCGRSNEFHGARLMNLDDGDMNFEANAKLIAAAPDLLEALIEVEEWEKTNFIEQSLLEKINNAINKATL